MTVKKEFKDELKDAFENDDIKSIFAEIRNPHTAVDIFNSIDFSTGRSDVTTDDFRTIVSAIATLIISGMKPKDEFEIATYSLRLVGDVIDLLEISNMIRNLTKKEKIVCQSIIGFYICRRWNAFLKDHAQKQIDRWNSVSHVERDAWLKAHAHGDEIGD